MKILHTADWHLGKKLESYPRLPEQREIMQEICTIADTNDVDVVLIAGDIFDTFNPPTEAVELFYKTVKKLSNYGKRPVIVIAGNHDSPDRIEAPDPLALENGIFLLGYPNSKIKPIELESELKIIQSEEGFAEVFIPKSKENLRIIFTPYANEHRLKTAFNIENEEAELKQVLADSWEKLADKYCDTKGINILLSHHFFVQRGKKAIEDSDEEKPILYVGGAQAIETDLIPKQIQYTALGHLHRFQNIGTDQNPIIYSGSPLAYSFAEADQKKYINIIEAKPNASIQFERIQLNNGKKLLRQTFDDIDTAVKWLDENKDSLVELTIQADEYLSSQDRKRLYAVHNGIINIIPQIKNSELLAGSDNIINLEQSREELFRQYFKYKKGQEPNDRIIDLFKEIIA